MGRGKELDKGNIQSIVKYSESHPLHGSPWRSVQVKWFYDDKRPSDVSPWELIPLGQSSMTNSH